MALQPVESVGLLTFLFATRRATRKLSHCHNSAEVIVIARAS